MADIVPIKQERLSNDRLIQELQNLLDRAQRGEIMAMMVVAETRGGFYEHARINVGFEKALGLLQRAAHRLNREWDQLVGLG